MCYYIRLIDEDKRVEFNNKLRDSLINLVNSVKICETDKNSEKNDKSKEEDEENYNNSAIGDFDNSMLNKLKNELKILKKKIERT